MNVNDIMLYKPTSEYKSINYLDFCIYRGQTINRTGHTLSFVRKAREGSRTSCYIKTGNTGSIRNFIKLDKVTL